MEVNYMNASDNLLEPPSEKWTAFDYDNKMEVAKTFAEAKIYKATRNA